MQRCARCGSAEIRWFTPHRRVDRGGIFLCLECSKINVLCPRPDPISANEGASLSSLRVPILRVAAGRRRTPGLAQSRRWNPMDQLDMQVEIMRAAGLADDEILRLAMLKQRVSSGQCDDLTIEYKRFSFLKYLYEEGRVCS